MNMMYEYLLNGRESGFTVSTNAKYYVYLRDMPGRSWQETFEPLKNTVIFIEENNNFIFSREFAEYVLSSGNYFVFISRSPLKMLPYSIHEIYEIKTRKKQADVRQVFCDFQELYSNFPDVKNNRMSVVVTEDSNSGYEFYSALFEKNEVISAEGNSNIANVLKEQTAKNMFVIADVAAFGSMVEDCFEFVVHNLDKRISMWMPESFEYILLKAGIIQNNKIDAILDNPSEYIECKRYPSWERFFTEILICFSDEKYKYSKKHLNPYYVLPYNLEKVKKYLWEGLQIIL